MTSIIVREPLSCDMSDIKQMMQTLAQ